MYRIYTRNFQNSPLTSIVLSNKMPQILIFSLLAGFLGKYTRRSRGHSYAVATVLLYRRPGCILCCNYNSKNILSFVCVLMLCAQVNIMFLMLL